MFRCLLVFVVLLLPVAAPAEGFAPVLGPCDFEFPRDHGPHEGHRTEWWYYTGNVADAAGRTFGFQLTFFRRALEAQEGPQGPVSAWRTRQVWLAHAAITDIQAGEHRFDERMGRGAVGLAGAEFDGRAWTLRVLDWEMVVADGPQRLRARGEGFAMDLELEPLKAVVAHGDGGYSRKGRRPESASCYSGFTRLRAAGTLAVAGREHRVEGLAWMDHEYSSALLEPEWLGWDWFSLQLDDGSELMAFTLRNAAGELSPASSGSLVRPDGSVALHERRSVVPVDAGDGALSAGDFDLDGNARTNGRGRDIGAYELPYQVFADGFENGN